METTVESRVDTDADVSVDDTAGALPELSFPDGLPGFPGARRFALEHWGTDESSPFSVMLDLDEDNVRFLVVPPGVFFPEYAAALDDQVVARLGLENADDALLLVIVTLPEVVKEATANLAGPVVVNVRSRTGMQAVLNDPAVSTRTPLPLGA